MGDRLLLTSTMAVAALCLGAVNTSSWASNPAEGDGWVPGEILVRLDDGLRVEEAASLQISVGVVRVRALLLPSVEKWAVPPGQEEAMAEYLSGRHGVVWAEPNFLCHGFTTIPDDFFLSRQWGHTRVGSTAAWDVSTGGNQVTIAVIDTGVDTTHPDLVAKLVPGYDFVEDDSDPTDLHGHGTHVAGIAAAATNNGVGIAGMSWGAMIMPVRVLDKDGWGSYEDISNGITWAATHGADILNLSLGGTSYSQAMQDAVNAAHAAGVLVVAAMGNDRGTNSTNYPAACTNVMAVAAANIDNRYANYSQYGAHCDIAAPGGEMSYLGDSYGVFSTLPTYDCTFTTAYGYSKNYDYLQGTSQAAPFVSGLAAIFRSIAPSFTPDQVQALIQDTATDLGPAGWDQDYGWGRINAAAALSAYVFADGFEFDNTSAWSATVP